LKTAVLDVFLTKMRVLVVSNINSSHTKKWVLSLVKQGVEVGLFSLNCVNTQDNWYKDIQHIFFPSRSYNNLPIKYFTLYVEIKKMMKIFKPGIVHSHYLTNYSLLVNLTGFKPHVVTAWGSDVFEFPKQNIVNYLILNHNLKKASEIISTSEVMAIELKKYTSRPIQIIPFGIDFKLFYRSHTTLPNDGKEIHLACFKKIEKIYGIDVLLQAFAKLCTQLPNHKIKLTIAGDGKLLPKMKNMAAELGIAQNVFFTGWINSEQIPEILKTVDICVYLSKHESFGVSLIEAMASGIPLVVTKTPGFLEVAESSEFAQFVNVNDVEDTALKIKELIENPNLYEVLSEKAFKLASKKYDLERCILSQIDLYKNLISNEQSITN